MDRFFKFGLLLDDCGTQPCRPFRREAKASKDVAVRAEENDVRNQDGGDDGQARGLESSTPHTEETGHHQTNMATVPLRTTTFRCR